MRAGLLVAVAAGAGAIPAFMGSVTGCGGDAGDGAFGGGGGGTATQSASSTVTTGGNTPLPSTSSTTTTTTGSQSGGGDGGAGDGGSSSSGGGSTSDGGSGQGGDGQGGSGEGGSSTTLTGAGGGLADVACDNGCVPFPSNGSGGGGSADDDCDDDGDPNLEDCQPCDPLVFHGQSTYFDVAYLPFEENAAPSFDYNCSGSAQFEYESQDDGCTAYTAQNCPEDAPIYTSNDPVCGASVTVQDCQVTGAIAGIAGTCSNAGPASTMNARCR